MGGWQFFSDPDSEVSARRELTAPHFTGTEVNNRLKKKFVNLYSTKFHDEMTKCALQYGNTLQIELEFGKIGFRVGSTSYPEHGTRMRTNNKLNPHMPSSPGIEPGAHWWEASALTTAPSLPPSRHPTTNKETTYTYNLGSF